MPKKKTKTTTDDEEGEVELAVAAAGGGAAAAYDDDDAEATTATTTTMKKKTKKKSGSTTKSKKDKMSATSGTNKGSTKKLKGKMTTTPAIMTEEDEQYRYPVLEASGWAIEDEVGKGTHQGKYAITGHEAQVVTIALAPGETCKGEPGSMMYLSPNVGLMATCEGCCARCLSGEDCCVMNFTNDGNGGNNNNTGYAALVPSDPLAKVVPIDLSSPSVGGTLVVQKGAFMASYGNVSIGISCDTNFCRCCCGGMGLIRQKIEGTGTAFLGATGTIVQKVLADKETMIMDTNCLLAYASSCTFDLKRTGGILNMVGGGEGIFNSSITGPGLVIVQSMNKQLLLDSLAANKIYRR